MLDRTPIGSFIEIEGADEAAINAVAQLLGLDENQKTDKSYTQLFEEWRNATGYAGRDMVFK
jgi:adenylate cyclase class IV